VYHKEGLESMPDRLPPEIMRVDLSNVILKLKGLGIEDILTFDMLERPDERHIAKAIDILYAFELI
jgi:HrpA-like RNA helicase